MLLPSLIQCPTPCYIAALAGIKDSKKHLYDIHSVAHDVKELASISAELAEQQAAVQQQLAASQELAEAMRQQAALHNCSMDEVVGHFFNVYNIACFVATDRERCATQQNLACSWQNDADCM
jgi:hypothetical protein